MKRLQLLLLCLWAFSLSAFAHDYMFKHLEVKDGLSNNQVNAIYKDSNGFMWFGTASGLNRYDGYDIKVYRSRKGDGTTLPDSYIQDIQEDASGQLWVRTGTGYAVYSPASDAFDCDMEARLQQMGIGGALALVYIDREDAFWIYIYNKGIYSYRAGQERAAFVKGSAELVSKTEVSAMRECGEGILLVQNNGVLACIDKEACSLKWTNQDIVTDGKEAIRNGFDLFIDRSERAWIFGVEGVWLYNLPRKVWEQRSPRTDVYNTVRAVAQDKYGCIWAGKDLDGIELTEPTGQKISLTNKPNNGRTLPDNTITALYEDEDGTMWVGTYKKGISFYNESVFKFGIAEVGDINCVEDGDGDIVWLGTNDRGLICWNSVTDERTTFSHTADPRSISSDVIVCLLRDSEGRMWAGTYWGGLNCYDGNRFLHYRAGGDGNSLVHDNVWALVEDADRNLWIGTLGGGLQCLNLRTGLFTTYSTANSDLVSDYISSLCIGHDGNLVVGTSAGMSFMDLKTRKLTTFGGAEPDKCRLSSLSINQVYTDSRGLLWIATREGLNVYDDKRDELYEVPIKPDFFKQLILGIAEDENKSMWVSTGGELINVVLSVDSKTERPVFRCYAYNDKDGLQGCDFNQRSLKRLHTGEIVVGGLYGLNRFRPDNIKYNRTLPKVMFTGFQLFNEEVKVGGEYAGRVILKEALNESREVVLDYKQNVFTILFASDNFVLPEKTQYFYKLDGFNSDWLTSDMHRVTYTNLAPGTYTLRVKATNSDGYAGAEEACLKIVILPPFWLTMWAYIVYALLIVGAIVFSIYLVHRREHNKFKLRQLEEDAKKKEELSQMKFRFFTNVSHELRTPLTLIISPMEGMMQEVTDEKLRGKLQLMYRNAQRLLNLVNQLLDFRKNEMAGLHLTLSEGDIVAYVRSICHSFLMLSEKKHVHLTFFSAMESLNMSFDEDKIGKVVMNLLSNAFKFTPEGGRVEVALEMSKEVSGKLLIKVSDTGIGIKDEDKERIFERFYQVEQEEPRHQSTGSGIGLSLVRDFVTLHEGTVRVLDNVGTGSVFLIELPVKHVHVGSSQSGRPVGEEETCEVCLSGMKEEPLDAPDASMEENKEEKEKPLALIVDDNADLVAFMKDSLSLYFRIQSASNGKEACRKIPELMPDIIVSDVMMPEMDGNELCRWVKTDRRTCDIPMILLTARLAVEDKLEGLTIGADDYVTKPFNVEILILRMRKLIELSKKRKVKTRIDPEPSEIAITSLDEKLVENAIKYVEANISRCDLSVEELSRELGMSRVRLYKKLSQITGKTPIEFIRIIRLKRAAQLLRESQQNVSEIAYQLGFNNPKYFSKYFKDEFGVLPSVYQEREGK
ncbi:MAG: helix-turn-helix domain-containing protein [Bacteroides sp.]|nr:helix-turn-helix domain-containing protein [Bacteroides sp.]